LGPGLREPRASAVLPITPSLQAVLMGEERPGSQESPVQHCPVLQHPPLQAQPLTAPWSRQQSKRRRETWIISKQLERLHCYRGVLQKMFAFSICPCSAFPCDIWKSNIIASPTKNEKNSPAFGVELLQGPPPWSLQKSFLLALEAELSSSSDS